MKIDIAFSGMFYVLVDTSRLRAVMGNNDKDDLPEMVPENGKFYAKLGAEIRKAAAEQFPVRHPVIGLFLNFQKNQGQKNSSKISPKNSSK